MALSGLPRTHPLTAATRLVTDVWDRWLQGLLAAVNRTTQLVGTVVTLSAQHAAVTTTDVPTGALAGGVYRLSYVLQVTQAASVSSSVTVTAGWTANAQTFSVAGATLTANTLTTQDNGSLLMNVDAGTPITYAVAYTSSGSTALQYSLSVRAEQLP